MSIHTANRATLSGCVLEVRGKPIFPEWIAAARGYSSEWIQRMLNATPTPVYPGDLRKLLKKNQAEWDQRRRAPPPSERKPPEPPKESP